MTFTYHLPTKIIFGLPALEALDGELRQLDARRVLLVSDPGLDAIGLVQHFRAGLSTMGRAIIPFTAVSSNPSGKIPNRSIRPPSDLKNDTLPRSCSLNETVITRLLPRTSSGS